MVYWWHRAIPPISLLLRFSRSKATMLPVIFGLLVFLCTLFCRGKMIKCYLRIESSTYVCMFILTDFLTTMGRYLFQENPIRNWCQRYSSDDPYKNRNWWNWCGFRQLVLYFGRCESTGDKNVRCGPSKKTNCTTSSHPFMDPKSGYTTQPFHSNRLSSNFKGM